MRLALAFGCLLLVGCAGPHSSGALWAQQNLERETAVFRLSDAQRADATRTFELGLADETIAAERTRVGNGLETCPGPGGAQLVMPSPGDRARDTARIRVPDDQVRMAALAQVALADWRLRRARGTGDARFCEEARQALTGALTTAAPADLLAGLGMATVTRDPARSVLPIEAWPPSVALSNYALGYVDTVRAQAPLPQYLAEVYGGVVLGAVTAPGVGGETPEALVDRFAPAYPEWEPDALYAALATLTTQ